MDRLVERIARQHDYAYTGKQTQPTQVLKHLGVFPGDAPDDSRLGRRQAAELDGRFVRKLQIAVGDGVAMGIEGRLPQQIRRGDPQSAGR